MIKIRKSEDRGKANHGWLNSHHTFSFADYDDPKFTNFQSLRVINEDIVAPGKGFGTHSHNNMEIISYVVSGELTHKDSMGNGRTIKAGEIQAMSAGTGVNHSEFNPSSSEPVHFLQIWIVPDKKNIPPSYSEWKPKNNAYTQNLTLVASSETKEGSIKIQQDVSLYLGNLKSGDEIKYGSSLQRHLWLQLIEGELIIENERIFTGDGVAVSEAEYLEVRSLKESKFLLFDLN